MNEFKLGNTSIPYTLRRSGAATRLRIEMTMSEMHVTAPSDADSTAIERALYGKRRWIVENYAELSEKYQLSHKIARFQTGAKVPYWGRLTRLTTTTGNEVAVGFRNGLHVTLPSQQTAKLHDDTVEDALQGWMRDRLSDEAGKFCRRYAQRLSTEFVGLRIAALRTRWGSCGANGVVSFDWHLVFGPKRVLEYVVAHELAHRIERNHSDAFWRKVRSVFGDYETEHCWLTENEHLLGYVRMPLTVSTPQRASHSPHSQPSATQPTRLGCSSAS